MKLSKVEMDFTIAFLLSRWSKNIYGTFNLRSGCKSYAPRKIARSTTGTTGRSIGPTTGADDFAQK